MAQYYRARYYDSSYGRFLSEDPLPDGSALYVYVANSPTRFVDPSGLAPQWWNTLMYWWSLTDRGGWHPPAGPSTGWPVPQATRLPFKCVGSAVCDFTADMQNALDCFRVCLGRQPSITCGHNGHAATDPHMRGEAVDLGHGSNSWLTTDDATQCFNSCYPESSYAQEEYNSGKSGSTHYHIQYSPGRGGAHGFSPTIHGNGS